MMQAKKYPYQNLSLKSMQGEVWKDIPGFEDEYQLSNYGRLKSQDRWVNYGRHDGFRPGRIRKLTLNGNKKRNSEDLQMVLHKDGKRYYFSVARYVYNLFVAPFNMEDHTLIVTRKDRDTFNCRYKNLVLRSISDVAKEGFALNKRKSLFQLQIRPVTQFDENGKRIATYSSTKEASQATGINARLINGAAQKENRMAIGFFWRYGNLKNNIDIANLKNNNPKYRYQKTDINSFNRNIENLPSERWEAIEGFEGLYEISDYGRVKSLRRLKEIRTKNLSSKYWTTEFIMKQSLLRMNNQDGKQPLIYLSISLKRNGAYKSFIVSNLVYQAFGENKNEMNKKKVIHADGNSLNNHILNLKLSSQSEILKASYKNENRKSRFALLTSEQRREYSMKGAMLKRKAVEQYDLKGNHIASFNSIATAAANIGILSSTISNAINGRHHTAGGFIWRFAKA